MSRTFEIEKQPFCEEILFKKDKITIEPGLTVFVGCNGSGKTTLYHALKEKLNKESIPVFSYDNVADGGDRARSRAGFLNDFSMLAGLVVSSEGEQIMINIGNIVLHIKKLITEAENDEVWLFFDAVDSGFSIDNICDFKSFIYNAVAPHASKLNKTLYVICTANSYEMANGENCFDVINGKYIKFKDYESYKDFILETKKYKKER
jgi:energy-coupling factor transporter ATP-binding protein EcfA2